MVFDRLKKFASGLALGFQLESQQLSAGSKGKKRLHQRIPKEQPLKVQMEMEVWKRAIRRAEDPEKPRRDQLLALYKEYMRDGHLLGQVRKLKYKVMAEPYWMETEGGGEDKEAVKLFQRPWFFKYMETYLETDFYGHSLIDFDYPNEQGEFERFDLIPREYVVPELGQVLMGLNDQVGIPYRENIKLFRTLIEIGEPNDLGLLQHVGPDITWKRYGRSDWARRSERFGNPLTTLKTGEMDEGRLDEKEAALRNLGSTGYIIIDPDEEIDFMETKNTEGHSIYKDIAEFSNDEISKMLTGQTMTSDAEGGQYKGDMHERTEEHFVLAQMRSFFFHVNFSLIPFLKDWGYKLEGLTWKWVKPILEQEEEEESTPEEDGKNPTDPKGKDKLKAPEHSASAGCHCPLCAVPPEHSQHSLALAQQLAAKADPELKRLVLALAQRIHQEKVDNLTDWLHSDDWQALHQHIAGQLWAAAEQSYGQRLEDLEPGTPDQVLLSKLQENLYVFSAYKNYSLLQQVNSLLTTTEGGIRPWSNFKQEVLNAHQDYNVDWLQAEYNTAVATAQGAAKWQRFQENGARYFLQIRTAKDGKVRPSHAQLEGLTLPVDDPFWETHWIPFDWQCRCNIVRVPRAGREATDLSQKQLPVLPKMFANNAGKTGVVFPESHRYFDVNDKEVNNILRDVAKP